MPGVATPSQTEGSPADIGFAMGWVVVAAAIPAAIIGAGSWLLGLPPDRAGIIALVTAIAVIGLAALAFTRLRRRLLQPLTGMTLALDQLRSTGQAPRLAEDGVPFLQPMLRRFNQACGSVIEREQLSRANLMSVEVAFDRVHSVLQSLREGVVVIDVNGRVVLANRSARQAIRSDSGAIEGRMLTELVDGELAAAVGAGLARIDSRQAEETRTTDIVHRGGFYDLTMVQVQSTRPDHDFGKVVVLVDVTKNHEINRLKDELLSSISHELRTPLTNMCSSSEILMQIDPHNEAEWHEFVRMLNVESHRLKSLVDDVMEYSQIEMGRVRWQLDAADLTVLARSAIDLIRSIAQQKRIQIGLRSDGGNTHARIDRSRITEVLCRVLDNALKFTPEGGRVEMTVTAREDLVDLAIADSGPGVAPPDRERIFERFTQIGDLMTDKPKGAGLGLSICQRIIDAMGGTMWCEESPLGGAQIRFIVPACAPEPAASGAGRD